MENFNLKFDGYWIEPHIYSIPAKSGIYCVYVCNYNEYEDTVDLKRLIYIGEAGYVQKRIKSHEKWPEWRIYLTTAQQLCFSFAPISQGRNRVEAACIYEHQPPENVDYRENFPFDSATVTTSGRNRFLKKRFTVNSILSELFWC